MSLSILLTNITLGGRTGTEIQTRNIAVGLLRRGHKPVVYSPILGPIASELRSASVPVVDNICNIKRPIDIIHGHHLPTTVTALARFPNSPAIFVCHDFVAWHDAPPRLPAIRRYVAVDDTVADRLTAEGRIPGALVNVILNAVDVERFRPGPKLVSRPRRALAFAKNLGHLEAIRLACAERSIALDEVGQATAAIVDKPEEILPGYDLVFATALTAMEAMACGRAVVICDGRGLAGFCTFDRYREWRNLNFGIRALSKPLTLEAMGAEIDLYDPREAERVCEGVRAEGGMDRYLDKLVSLYQSVIEERHREPHSAEAHAEALAAHLQDWYPNADGGWPWMLERQSLLKRLDWLSMPIEIAPLDTGLWFYSGENRPWHRRVRGFSEPENWGVWTVSNHVVLLFRVGEAGDVDAEFTLHAYANDRNPEVIAGIMLNGATLGEWRFTAGADQQSSQRVLRIPRDLIGDDGSVWLNLSVQNCRSPLELGLSTDPRRLGVGFVSLVLRRASEPVRL